MKKLFIVAIIALLGVVQAEAQVTFKPGLRGGLNFAHFTKGDYYNDSSTNINVDKFSSKTDFYLGFYGALHLTKYYTLQPEIDYSNQGSTINYIDRNNISRDTKLNASYLSIAVINKFTFNKFNVLLGPSLDFVVDKNFHVENDVDLTFQLGAGFDITKNFGIEARIKKGIVPAYKSNNYNGVGYYSNSRADHTNVVFSLGATYTFDIK
ncbi:hypothetical protein IA01_11210 [Flavobacterium psychrophilum]|uniref:Outer membrane protein beta-barrel domain-containing protein n=1 Tax=Flavobacterium psychrophilum (strain ATCC 49511 / DSM 21280 / CIP 103535 / JIP02/86) TaxID=402612 RepID=A6H1U2_FLAPJ|nr:outer membrane beta-barrel protein [Flavobacterium psychrophilum]AIG30986.1 hypothetical protein IA03_11180 [Flavobacterium psychrophilum]AIG33263.1 hypothetical protein IA01_11210 [Flavobacterium psychrophilum]AIG35412.1 hypothetical protein IA02_10575 [Flavobacterium psychrophilum]AIG37773.1 hypothetical protein IA04_11055 [Flavobacterium psychrophilum]AIG40044.1 hypothetical protein IA05_11175 [Flavobacterium psychrophilum]